MLLVAANNGITGMCKEHFHLSLALKLPSFVVVTKIDICPGNIMKQTIEKLVKMLKAQGANKMPIFVRSQEDLDMISQTFGSSLRVCPIFLVSNVTGAGLDLVKSFVRTLKSQRDWMVAATEPTECMVDEIYTVPGVGTVIAGTLIKGLVRLNDTLLLGPDSNGLFIETVVKGIHTNRFPVEQVFAGRSCSFALKKVKRRQVRKGMVLVAPSLKPKAHWEFKADVLVITHATTIGLGYQAVIHCGVTRQAAQILDMSNDVLRSGTRSKVRFRFLYRPEFLKGGEMLIFREGKTKGMGRVFELVDRNDEMGNEDLKYRRAMARRNIENTTAENENSRAVDPVK